MNAPQSDPHHYQEAVSAWRRRVPVAEDVFRQMEAEARELAFTVSGVSNADVVQDVWNAIDGAVRDGTDFATFKASVGKQLSDSWEAEDPPALDMVFRTNVMTAYSAGRHAVLTAPAAKDAFPYWRFDAIDDGRIDDDCEACDGTVLAQDDPWWSSHHPPLHPNCRCSQTPLSREDVEKDDGPDDDGPDVDAAPGFGERPSVTGADWQPDLDRFAPPIRERLADLVKP